MFESNDRREERRAALGNTDDALLKIREMETKVRGNFRYKHDASRKCLQNLDEGKKHNEFVSSSLLLLIFSI